MFARNYRKDNQSRWESILDSMGDVSGKTLVDIGCHNGYFCQKFLLSGGGLATGVENNPEFIFESNSLNMKNFEVFDDIKKVNGNFDFCLFLDLQYHEGINLLRWCKDHAKVSFISPSGDGRSTNGRLEHDLKEVFDNFSFVSNSDYAHRSIYRCE